MGRQPQELAGGGAFLLHGLPREPEAAFVADSPATLGSEDAGATPQLRQSIMVDQETLPYFAPLIDKVQHDNMAHMFNAFRNAKNIALGEQIEGSGPMPFPRWWEEFGKCKGEEQWAKKLEKLGVEGIDPGTVTRTDIGNFLYRRLAKTGRFAEKDLQMCPHAD